MRTLTASLGGIGPVTAAAAAAVFAGGLVLVVLMVARRPDGWRSVDLDVYRAAAWALLHGRDIYTAYPGHPNQPFVYPPFAALSFAPMALLGQVGARVVLTTLSTVALVLCLGLSVQAVRPGWTLRTRWTVALLVSTAALFTDPVYATLSSGQVNLLLVALVLFDLLGRRTVLPRGTLVGVAAAVTLTPAIFVGYLVLTRRPRAAVTAVAVLVASMAGGYLVAPGPSLEYWGGLVVDPDRAGGAEFAGNQSLRGMITRLAGAVDSVPPGWMVSAAVTLAVGLWLSARACRGRDELLGVSLCAVTGLLVSPVAWNHRWVWALPVAVVLWARFLDLRAPGRLAVAAGWTAVFCLAPIWWVPYRNGLEFTRYGVQLLAGNAYVLAGLVLLAGAPLLLGPIPFERGAAAVTGLPGAAGEAALQDAVR